MYFYQEKYIVYQSNSNLVCNTSDFSKIRVRNSDVLIERATYFFTSNRFRKKLLTELDDKTRTLPKVLVHT